MAPKKPKVKKSIKRRVKKKVAEPAKSVIERTIRKHPMLRQVQVRETLKIVLRKFSKMKKFQTTRYLRVRMVRVVVYG